MVYCLIEVYTTGLPEEFRSLSAIAKNKETLEELKVSFEDLNFGRKPDYYEIEEWAVLN